MELSEEKMIELAQDISFEQLEELIARVCIRETLEADPIASLEQVKENSGWLFYSGMNGERNVMEQITKILKLPKR